MFELHPTLKKDTFLIKDLKLCRVLLMDNSIYPWVILVPKRPDLVEMIDLTEEDQFILTQEISQVSRVVKDIFKADKLNIAALGNVVSQLHIHIIARYKNDPTFPQPIWVNSDRKSYGEDERRKIINLIATFI